MGDMANWYLENALEEQFNREMASGSLLEDYKRNNLVEWKTREGKFISIKDMTTTHITNTSNMLKRTNSTDPVQESWLIIFELELNKRLINT